MGHRFLPAPLFSGTVMRIRGPGPILRASIHISGPGRVQSARAYRHTRIHIYMHTPAHRGAAGLPQGPDCAPTPPPVRFEAPGTPPAPPPALFQAPARSGPDPAFRRCGRRALPNAPTKPRVVPGNPWRGCSLVGICCRAWPRHPLAWLLSGGHRAPHLPRRTPLRRHRASGTGVPQRLRASLAGPPRPPRGIPAAPEHQDANATQAANNWQIPAWFGRDAGAAPIPARARLRPLPKENVK